jgi:lipoprotein-releasing system permease protein
LTLNLSLFIAKRYFRSKKKRNFIQVISLISMVAVAIGTAALIIVLSVFNGLEELIRDSYNTFDPEIKVVPAQGKSFTLSDSLMDHLSAVKGVDIITEVIEDNALARYRDAPMPSVSPVGLVGNRDDRRIVGSRAAPLDFQLRHAADHRRASCTTVSMA